MNAQAGLDATFSALSDPTRRAMLSRLSRGEATVTSLAAPFDISLPAISKHLRVLERAGLIHREKRGRVHRLRLKAEPMRKASEWLDFHQRFWEEGFDALARYLDETTDTETSK